VLRAGPLVCNENPRHPFVVLIGRSSTSQ
jgi:hypothetical protein